MSELLTDIGGFTAAVLSMVVIGTVFIAALSVFNRLMEGVLCVQESRRDGRL